MSIDISMQSTSYQVGDRRWLLSEPQVKLNVTLDPSKFTANTHYPNGYIPAGTVVGIVTTGGLAGPYDNTASDGTQTAYGVLYGDARVIRQNGTTSAKVTASVIVNDAIISAGKMPFTSGTGSIDTAGKADLALIRWEA